MEDEETDKEGRMKKRAGNTHTRKKRVDKKKQRRKRGRGEENILYGAAGWKGREDRERECK